MADEALLLSWRSDIETQYASRASTPISVAQHHKWLSDSLKNSDRVLLVCEDRNETPLATVRFDLDQMHGERVVYEVSITVAPNARRRGVGMRALIVGEKFLVNFISNDQQIRLVAFVRASNAPSEKLFAACGYRSFVTTNEGFWFSKDL